MDNYTRENTSAVRRREKEKKMKTKPARHFQVGYIHNQRSIKLIYIYIYIYIIIIRIFFVFINLTYAQNWNIA